MLRDTDKKVQSSKNTWHSNSNASCCPSLNLNCDDGGLLPDAYLHLVRKKAAN